MIQLAVIAAAPARFDYYIFLEAPHGTELARYGSPWASEIGITPQPGICTNPPTPNLSPRQLGTVIILAADTIGAVARTSWKQPDRPA